MLAKLYYSTTLALGFYVLVFQIIVERGYQSCDTALGSTYGRVSGAAVTPDNDIFDAALLTQPGHEPEALFVATRSAAPIRVPASHLGRVRGGGGRGMAICTHAGAHTTRMPRVRPAQHDRHGRTAHKQLHRRERRVSVWAGCRPKKSGHIRKVQIRFDDGVRSGQERIVLL